MIINGATATAPFCKQGTLRAIAVTGPARLADFPDVPTFAELGWPAAQSGTWQGVLAQGATPPAMVNRLATDIRAAMAVPATAERITALGAVNKAEGRTASAPGSMRRSRSGPAWCAPTTSASTDCVSRRSRTGAHGPSVAAE